jgi:hypothetical protein
MMQQYFVMLLLGLSLIVPIQLEATPSAPYTITLIWPAPLPAPDLVFQDYRRLHRVSTTQTYDAAVCTTPVNVQTCQETITQSGTYVYVVVADGENTGSSDYRNAGTVWLNLSETVVPPLHLMAQALPTSEMPVIPQGQLRVVSVDSQDTLGGNYAGTHALDGDPATMWHTEWYQRTAPLPHAITLDLGREYLVGGFRYLPRQDGQPHGTIAEYQCWVSPDNLTWGTAVATGTFAANMSDKTVRFPAKRGRYVRLLALSEITGQAYTSAAELNIFGIKP